jgi:hypothetical protein
MNKAELVELLLISLIYKEGANKIVDTFLKHYLYV